MRRRARFGNILHFKKSEKHPWWGVPFNKDAKFLAQNCTKIDTPSWVF